MAKHETAVLAVYISTRKDSSQLRRDESALTNWLVTNGIASAKWFRDPTELAGLPRSETFRELLKEISSGEVSDVLSIDLAGHVENLLQGLPHLIRLLSSGRSLVTPEVGARPFALISAEILAAAASTGNSGRGELISAGLNRRKKRGKPIGGRVGNKNRLGKVAPPDPAVLNEIHRLLGNHSDREIASQVGLSAATICRYRKRYLEPNLSNT